MRRLSVSILGCGWLGFPLAKQLVEEGYLVKGSVTTFDKHDDLRNIGVKPYVLDLSKEINQEAETDFFKTEVLIVTIPPRSKTQAAGAYLTQVQRLVAWIQQHPTIQQVIYTSSTSVYPDRAGWVKEHEVHEAHHSAYAELVDVENLFLSLPDRTITIVRLGGLTGGSRLLVRHFAGKKGLKNGKYPVNLIHQEDAVRVLTFVLEHRLSGTFNACSPIHPNKHDFYTAMAQRFHMPLPEFSEDKEEGKTIDVTKLEQQGFVFSYPDPAGYTYDEKDSQ